MGDYRRDCHTNLSPAPNPPKTALSRSLFVGERACSSRCIEPLYSRNHCKRTIIPRHTPNPSKPRTIPRKSPTPLPPLSKGGGLTARHKLLLCCFLLAICPLFLYCKLFCRQDGGIALHHRPFQNRTIPRKRGGSVARSSRANYGGDCSCLEVVSLIPLVLFLFHIDRYTHSNSEPEKCYLAKRTIGSLLS